MISSNKLALTLVLIVAIAAIGFSATAYAQTRTINADKVTIKKGEDITINVNGGVGQKGEKGDTGPAGPAGAPGQNGANGTGVSPDELATLNTILQLYNNGSLSSVSISAENITTPVVCGNGEILVNGTCQVTLPPITDNGTVVTNTTETNSTG